jgi:hypothetical protein
MTYDEQMARNLVALLKKNGAIPVATPISVVGHEISPLAPPFFWEQSQ